MSLKRTVSNVPSAHGSEASRAQSANPYSVAGQHSSAQYEKEYGLRKVLLDAASDTSSVRERKFANLLGGSDSDSEPDRPATRNVGHRLYHVGTGRERIKQERMREQREQLLMQEMAQMTQRPNITRRAQSKPSKGAYFADHATMWSVQRDQHIRQTAKEVNEERYAEVRESPAINSRSDKIVRTAGEHKGPVRGWEQRFAKFCAKRSAGDATTQKETFSPNINANAVRVDVERSIAERLYEDSHVRKERLRMLSREQQARELVDEATGRPLFNPHALKSSPARSRSRTAAELSAQLHDDQLEQSRRKAMLSAAYRDPELTFSPNINKCSEILATRTRKPLYVPRAQREKEERERRERQRAKSAEASPRVEKGPVNIDEFLRRAQRNEIARAHKLAAIRDEEEDRETRECTFQPHISARSEDLFNKSNMSGAPMRSPLDALASPHSTDRGGTQLSFAASPQRTPKTQRGKAAAAEFAAVMAQQGVAADTGKAHSPGRQRTPKAVPALRAPSTGTDAQRSPSRGGGADPQMENVDHYIAQFESQMYTVLEEWRRLEEV